MRKLKIYSMCGGGYPQDTDVHYVVLPSTETLNSFRRKYQAWHKKMDFWDDTEVGNKNAGEFVVDVLGGRYATESEVKRARGKIQQVNFSAGLKAES